MPDGGGEADDARARKTGEVRIEHGAQNFPHPVGAEIEAQHAVAVLHAAIVADHRRNDELVEFFVGVGVGDDSRRIGKARPVGFDDGVVGFRHALPALVAIHGVVAAAHGGDRNGFRQRGDEALDVFAGRLRRRIAAIGERVHERRHAGIGENLRQRRGVILMRMHAAGRHQADEMTGAAAVFELCDQIDQRRHLLDVAVGDGAADARQILHDHAPGADIEMADLGIAHLAAGQADVVAGSVQKAVRPVPPQPVEGRRLGLADGVVGGIVAPTPAVQDHQHHRPPPLHVAKSFRSDNAKGVLRIGTAASISAHFSLSPRGERAG